MEILYHLLIFQFVEGMMIMLAVVLDGFSFAVIKGKRLNVKFPFLRVKVAPKRTVSRLSYIFQICNIVYVIIFVAFAIIASFISNNPFFGSFNFYTALGLFGLSFLVSGVLGFMAGIAYEDPKDNKKENDSNSKDDPKEDDSKTKNDQTENALDN